MAKKSSKQVWRIEGFASLDCFYERTIPLGYLSEHKMCELLKKLAARHLSEDETVDASLSIRFKGRPQLLEPKTESAQAKRFNIVVGDNPYYVASVWDASELRERQARQKR